MIVAELEGEKIALRADFRENERIKLVPGHRWDRAARQWTLPRSWSACVALRGVFGDQLSVGEALNQWAWEERQRVDSCLALRTAEDAPWGEIAEGPDALLYPLQRAGVEFLATARCALLGDPMGGGKTVQTIRALERIAARHGKESVYPAVIVCTSSMRWKWEMEFQAWAPGRTTSVVAGAAGARRKAIAAEADVIIVHWDILYKHARLAGYGYVALSEEEKTEKELNAVGFKSMVADEAHRIKNPLAKQTRAAWWLGDRVDVRFALTGTPIANEPEDLWAVMRFVSPEEYPYKTAYVNRYVEQAWSPFGFSQSVGLIAATKDEFYSIFDPRFLRRPKELLVPGLPAKLPPVVREVELPTKQRTAYNAMRKEMLAQLKSGVLVADNPLMKMLRLVQLASAHGDMGEPYPVEKTLDDGSVITEMKQDLTLADPSCKVDALMELLDEMGKTEPLVVFAESVQLIRLAAARLDSAKITWSAVTGDVVGADRQKAVDDFQNGVVRVILCSYGAGSEGITLTRANTTARLQRSWSSIHDAQSEDRTHRFGQTREVTIIDFIAKDTVESRMWAAIENKKAQLEEIVRDGATLEAWLAK